MRGLDSDTDLIARSVDEPAAFRFIFDRYYRDVHKYLWNRLRSERANDLAAETFLRAFAARATYEPHGDSARPWLFAIATNLLRDDARSARRGRRAIERLQAEAGPDPDDIGFADPRLRAALDALPRREREPLLLLAWGELSYEEIATALGLRVGTVRSRIHRARARLNAELAETDVPGVARPTTEGAAP